MGLGIDLNGHLKKDMSMLALLRLTNFGRKSDATDIGSTDTGFSRLKLTYRHRLEEAVGQV